MSERPRRKRKDETWTKEELTTALHRNGDKHRKEKSRSSEDQLSRELRKEKHSSHRNLDDERKSRRKIEEKERRHKERREAHDDANPRGVKREKEKSSRYELQDEEEYRREKEKRREERDRKREEGRSERRSQETPEERAKRKEKERRRREREERNGSSAKDQERRERAHGRREGQNTRNEDSNEDEEQRRRRERREEKRRKRHEAEELESIEQRNIDSEGNKRHKDRSKQVEKVHNNTDHDAVLYRNTNPREPEKDNNETNYDYDDEEFEDYEDDFEENESEEDVERNPEMDAIIKAINRENERVNSARTTSADSQRMQSNQFSSRASSASMSHDLVSTTINFSAAKQRSVESKTRKRVLNRRNDLLTLIQLDFISFDIFDLPPVTEYNFYIKNFGSQNSRQASSQCNDDAIEVEIQTDQSETGERWTQHPPDGAIVCGGSTSVEESPHLHMLSLMRDDSNRFSDFLTYAGELVDASIQEDTLWSSSKPTSLTSVTSCDATTKFNTNISYLQGRKILHTIFGNGMIAVTFGEASHDVTTRIDRKGIITVWKITNTEQPDKILLCDALPVTCCFGQNKKILFVGMDDGSVLVYDLTEPSTMHQQLELERNKMTVLRSATYTTGWQSETHSSPIVCLGSVGNFENTSQLFSIDESACLCVWVVVDILSDVDDDVGLVPHGRVKLVKSSLINVVSSKPTSATELGGSATFAVCPDSNTFFVGTELGEVVSCTREKKTKTYKFPGNKASVTSVSFNKFNSSLMLVSYKSGDLALFTVNKDLPVMTWPLDGVSMLFCHWSNCRSSVFFSLDSTNRLQVWDLMAIDSAPVSVDSLDQKAIGFSVDGNSQKATNLLVAFESCAFEVLRLKPHFTDSVVDDELEQMTSLVQSFG